MKKLLVALGVYAGLALLAWFTLDAPFKVQVRGFQIDTRMGALVVAFMALLTVRSLLHWWRERSAGPM
jgi:hypothetical protein